MATGLHTPTAGGPMARIFSKNAGHFVSLVRGRLASVVVAGQLGQSRDVEVARLTGARR